MTLQSSWEDERVLQSIYLFYLGVPEDRIMNDSWIYAAVKMISGHEDSKRTKEFEREQKEIARKMKR